MRVFLLLWGLAAAAQEPPLLTLREAEERALRNHPAIQAARFGAMAAAESPAQARAAKLPVVTGNVTGVGAPANTRIAAGAINNPAIFSRLAAGVSATQLLVDFGRTSHLAESLTKRAEAAEADAESIQNAVVLEVDQAYFAALRAAAVLRIAEETVKTRQVAADQIQALERARLKSELDLRFARVAVSEAELLASSARNERQAAMASLASAMGETQLEEVRLADERVAVTPVVLGESIEAAMKQRPDLRARELEHASAGELAESERRLKYPAVAAVLTAGVTPLHGPLLQDYYAAAGVNIGLPFLNGGLNKSRASEAQLRARAAAERARRARLEIVRDVTAAVLQVNTAAERMALSATLREQSSLALELAQSRYDLGLSSIVELTQAQLASTAAAVQNESANYDYQLQRAVLANRVAARR